VSPPGHPKGESLRPEAEGSPVSPGHAALRSGRRWWARCLPALLLVTLGLPAWALEGTVTHVTDGDTLWVRPAAGGKPVKLRLSGIDAPERCQAWGAESRRALAALVLKQAVRAEVVAHDQHGRRIGRLMRGGLDVGAGLVAAGHAWSQQFRGDPGPYAVQERQARQARRGLFAAARPERPGDFRKRHGPCPPGRAAAGAPPREHAQLMQPARDTCAYGLLRMQQMHTSVAVQMLPAGGPAVAFPGPPVHPPAPAQGRPASRVPHVTES
jgi:micrococcal nuclease